MVLTGVSAHCGKESYPLTWLIQYVAFAWPINRQAKLAFWTSIL
jgi:hypothetical protein